MADEDSKNIEFVLEVEKYPCLYNATVSGYSRKSETDKAWADIGKTMNMTGAACKEKWRNLRIVFTRHKKSLPNGSGKKKKPYYLFEYMNFLTPYVKPTISPEAGNSPSTSLTETNNSTPDDVSNVESTNQSTELYEIELTPVSTRDNLTQPSSNLKRKKYSQHEPDKHFTNNLKQKTTRLSEPQNSNDAVMSFLNSLAPELREMNQQQFRLFKRRALGLVDDILNAQQRLD